ncbi:TAP-like protein [Streptomyces yunnanensis]|uniref:TAP-like protein n=2 Tax=Streptomyces yunnanensis TaxID=156453 RepID=A0A9X8N9V0_9ACTN|nr:TAP-like protein [Streptomyces yunnanensis]
MAPIQCGHVTVPVDYAKPDGPTIKIAVDRVGNSGGKDKRKGALVYSPGGPGLSGLDFPTWATRDLGPYFAKFHKIAEAYDFVGFDPRGVGRSAPISCQEPQQFVKAPKPDPVPENKADKEAQHQRAKAYAEGCKERSGRLLPELKATGGLLPYMSTANTARDLEVLRAALGKGEKDEDKRKLNSYGISYGTYIEAVYATLFPGHVGRMLFDSVENPSQENVGYVSFNTGQNPALKQRWNDWKRWIAEHDATYHIGRTPEDVQKRWEELRNTAKKQPIGGVVGPAELTDFFQTALGFDSRWAKTAKAWSSYLHDDHDNDKLLIEGAGPDLNNTKAAENNDAARTAVVCADTNRWPTWERWDKDWEGWYRDNKGPYPAYNYLPCAVWQVEQQPPIEVKPGGEVPPALIVQSERDGLTPYQGATELHKRLKGSRLITEKDAGSHSVSQLANPCINDRVDAYFLEDDYFLKGQLKGKTDPEKVTCAPHAAPKP